MAILKILREIDRAKKINLTEADTPETTDGEEIKLAVSTYLTDEHVNARDKRKFSQELLKVINPNIITDEAADKCKGMLSDVEITDQAKAELKRKNIDASPFKTYGQLIDAVEQNQFSGYTLKGIIILILGILVLACPDPVLQIVGSCILIILGFIPADKFQQLIRPILTSVSTVVNWFKSFKQ